MFFYKNFTITSAFRFEIALILTYLVKLFRTIIKLTLASISTISI